MKKSFDKTEIQQDLPGIIILSHGPLAVALKETAEMVFSKMPNVAAFSLEYGDNANEYACAFQEAIEAFDAGCVILVDIMGGTPCNQLLIYAKNNGLKLNVIAGANLPMIVNALGIRSSQDLNGEELKKAIMESMEDYVRDISSCC